MSIIFLEGASAVGKTTIANEIARISNACVIPEVNLLFERPNSESKTWYLERQIERWKIAQEKLKTYDTVIFDGDIFQPLSYNWCFNYNLYNQSLEFISEFFRTEIEHENIKFPDKYFYLYTDSEILKIRKKKNTTRTRGNFERHLKIVEPHERYYKSIYT